MLRTIRSRLIASYLLVILLAMAVAATLAWRALDRAFLEVLRESLLAQARLVAQTAESGLALEQRSLVEAVVQPTAEAYSQASNVLPGYHTRVIDEEGAVILDLAEIDASASPEGPPSAQLSEIGALASKLDLDTTGEDQVELLRVREEIQSAMAGEPATAVRAYSWAPDRRVLYAAHPVWSADGSVSSVVYIASPLPRLSLSLLPTYFGPQVLAGAVLAILLAGATGVILARTLTRPLQRLTEAAAALARGGQAAPIPEARTAELSRLTAAFNTMNANLGSARDELIARAVEREIILDGLSDAVIAAATTGEITLTNPAGAALLELASDHVRGAIGETLASGEKQTTEFAARDRIIELVATPLGEDDSHITGVVVVGHDVTAHRQLDRLRTRFVSDVSHELRTPLTAIKGFVETLRNGAAEDPVTRDRFLETIEGETERLIRLASELLLLARADTGRLDLRLAPTKLDLVVRRAIAQLAGRAALKNLAITFPRSGAPVIALLDADRIQQVLINLLDNAVKFTLSGGTVSVSIRAAGQEALCTVADTGPGIPTDELPHLFGRFYRGDRSRARGEGQSGAGLGLAIARAIVDAHGGRIWVESKPPAGTAVSFTLPLVA